MNKILWTIQCVLAIAFLGVGAFKLATPYSELARQMPWVNDFSDSQVKAIGAAEVAGALGLILPSALRILPVLTPVAAGGLTLTMIGAAMTHAQRGEWPMMVPNLVLGLAAIFVAWGRAKKVPIAPKNVQ